MFYILKSYLTNTWKFSSLLFCFISTVWSDGFQEIIFIRVYHIFTSISSLPSKSPLFPWTVHVCFDECVGMISWIHRQPRIHKWEKNTIFDFMCLTYFSYHDDLQLQLFSLKRHNAILLNGWIKSITFSQCHVNSYLGYFHNSAMWMLLQWS